MTSQCSSARLEAALAGKLPADDEASLCRHLDECEECSAAMERMAGGTPWCQEAAALLTRDELDAVVPVREAWSEVDFTVDHLEPADEPNLLGRLGGYDILEIIGHGGMGVVLKGYDPELKRCVAIKVLAPHLAHSPMARKRFAREAQAAAAVVHANVLAIHQVQAGGRLPFLIMPLVAGESLGERLAAKGTLDLKEILRIGMQAAAGLAAAHEQGLVDRDVKLANILLEKGVERAVLTDFGLACAADDVALTQWGIVAGTPQYMSPEQARGEALDGRSDLFSLGCVLYEMATGVSPFRADSTMATMRRLVDDAPQAMASLNPELPPWFIAIVGRLLEKEPSRRFGSAKEVSELLEGCLAHIQQPANVPLPSALNELPPQPERGRRKPRYQGVLAMFAVLGIGLLGALGWLSTEPPDLAGQWTGEDWGTVVLKKASAGEYTGTYTDTVGKQPGEIQLKWSRIERRFNGTWREGQALAFFPDGKTLAAQTDRFGELSVRLAGDEIRGAFMTDRSSHINPGTPRLADLTWVRSDHQPDKSARAPEKQQKVQQRPEGLTLTIANQRAERMEKWVTLQCEATLENATGKDIATKINGTPFSNLSLKVLDAQDRELEAPHPDNYWNSPQPRDLALKNGDRIPGRLVFFCIALPNDAATYKIRLEGPLNHGGTPLLLSSNALEVKVPAGKDAAGKEPARTGTTESQKEKQLVPMEQFTGRIDGRFRGRQDSATFTFAVDERSYLRYQRLLHQRAVGGVGSPLYIGLNDENGFPHQGTLDGFNEEVDPKTGTVQARGFLPDPDRLLLPGMFVRVRMPFGLTDKERLLGAWDLISMEFVPKEEAVWIQSSKQERCEFKGDQLIATPYINAKGDNLIGARIIKGTSTFTIDAGKKPKEIDLKVEEGPVQTHGTMKGIYDLKGDELTLCVAAPNRDRPTEFICKKGHPMVLLRLKRTPSVAQTPVTIVLGPKAFRDGDVIEITDVKATSPKLEPGDSLTVRGRVRLASHNQATLYLYLTQTEGNGAEEGDPSQGIEMKRGLGDFELKATIKHRGVLHLTLYDPSGKPFGGVYFGTAAQMKEIADWSLDHYLPAKPPPAKRATDKELEGEWQGIAAAALGGRGKFSSVWEIKDGTIFSTVKDPKSAWKYRVDPDKSPKEIDLMPDSGVGAGKTLKGIYKVDKDTLTICYLSPSIQDPEKRQRPTEFDTKGSKDLVMLTFKRKAGPDGGNKDTK